MAASERAVIYVESGADLSSLAVAASTTSTPPKVSSVRGGGGSSTTTAVVTTGGPSRGSNYVIKIQIGEENMFRPVRIDVSTGKGGRNLRQNKPPQDEDSNSGQSSPRSDMTPPPRINTGAIRFGSETSESDTESDVSSEYRPVSCQAAQFALREICEAETPSPPPLPRDIGNNLHAISNTEFIQTQCQISTEEVNNNGYSFVSTSADSFEPRRLKSETGKNTILSPESIKAKAELDAEFLKHGKATSSSGTSRKTTLSRSKVLMSITENIAHNHTTTIYSPSGKQNHNGKLMLKGADSGITVEPNGFHLNEINECNSKERVENEESSESLSNFAGYRDIFSRNSGANPIMSEKGTIRGVKNRVRDGIATFLQSSDSKTYFEKEQGRVVVYMTSMGVVRNTFQRCQKVKQILRNLLVKFDERDCYMNRSVQNEIRHRLPNFNQLALPQVFLEGQHLGDAELIEKLNESGELRDLLRPYKSLSVLTTCERCGGFRMLPCPVCNGSKKSVHRNHFTTEFVALKCMHCDLSGLVRCDVCNLSEV